MPLTDSYVDVAKYLQTLIEANKVQLGVQDVFYGDQNRIPRTPTVCVDPGEKRRDLKGAPRRTEVTMVNYVIIYHNPVHTVRDNREEDDRLAEDLETLIHTNAQMSTNGDDLVVDSMVTMIESGYMMKSNTLFRAARLTVEARSIVQLPSSV